jgi:hypothetical protein
MAKSDCITNEPTSAIDQQPLYRAFSWLPNNIAENANAKFAANVMAVSYGCSTIANIVRRNSMAAESGVAPLMSGPDLDTLVGLLIFSVDTLRDAAEDQIDRLDAAALKGKTQ